MVKKTGTKDEVWAGTAMHTPGKLTKADLMLNKAGKVVSRKQSANGRLRVGALKNANMTRTASASVVHPDHRQGYQSGRTLREMHGKGVIGGLLGSILGPVLGQIPVVGDVLGGLAPALGGMLPI